MNTNRKQLAIGIGSLAASGLLTLAVPTGTSEAMIWKPPMPCVAVHAGVYPAGAGFCHGTPSGIDWQQLRTVIMGRKLWLQAPVTSTPRTPSPT